MGRRFDKFIVILGYTVITFPFFLSCSQSQPANDHVGNRSHIQTEDEAIGLDKTPTQTSEDIDPYWTEERMRKAKPMPIPGVIIPENRLETVPEGNLPIDFLPDPNPASVTKPQSGAPK